MIAVDDLVDAQARGVAMLQVEPFAILAVVMLLQLHELVGGYTPPCDRLSRMPWLCSSCLGGIGAPSRGSLPVGAARLRSH